MTGAFMIYYAIGLGFIAVVLWDPRSKVELGDRIDRYTADGVPYWICVWAIILALAICAATWPGPLLYGIHKGLQGRKP